MPQGPDNRHAPLDVALLSVVAAAAFVALSVARWLTDDGLWQAVVQLTLGIGLPTAFALIRRAARRSKVEE